jgi:hypothetical protein
MMAACKVIGSGPWAEGAATALAALGHTVERAPSVEPREDKWVFWEDGPYGTCVPWLVAGCGPAEFGEAATLRWHAVYGRDGGCP